MGETVFHSTVYEPCAVLSTSTVIFCSPVGPPVNRCPTGSVTITDDRSSISGPLNRRVTTPGAAARSLPGSGGT